VSGLLAGKKTIPTKESQERKFLLTFSARRDRREILTIINGTDFARRLFLKNLL